MFEYENLPCLPTVSEITVEILTNWWTPRYRHPTRRELASVPERFRCFTCGVVKGRAHFGGYLLRQRICQACYPWVDEPLVGALIRWDELHHFTQFIRE
jgi:hypothetical protein